MPRVYTCSFLRSSSSISLRRLSAAACRSFSRCSSSAFSFRRSSSCTPCTQSTNKFRPPGSRTSEYFGFVDVRRPRNGGLRPGLPIDGRTRVALGVCLFCRVVRQREKQRIGGGGPFDESRETSEMWAGGGGALAGGAATRGVSAAGDTTDSAAAGLAVAASAVAAGAASSSWARVMEMVVCVKMVCAEYLLCAAPHPLLTPPLHCGRGCGRRFQAEDALLLSGWFSLLQGDHAAAKIHRIRRGQRTAETDAETAEEEEEEVVVMEAATVAGAVETGGGIGLKEGTNDGSDENASPKGDSLRKDKLQRQAARMKSLWSEPRSHPWT